MLDCKTFLKSYDFNVRIENYVGALGVAEVYMYNPCLCFVKNISLVHFKAMLHVFLRWKEIRKVHEHLKEV